MSDEHNDIHAALDELGAPRASTTAMRIRGLHRDMNEASASALANARAGLDTAIAERGEFIRQRDEALAKLEAGTRARSEAECLRDAALREARSLTHERDNCREVLAREREERAAEKATLGAALHTLRAETETLGESVERLNAENERLAAQLEFAERVLIAGIRRATP